MINKQNLPLILIILDGWGIAPEHEGNILSQANLPNFKRLISIYPSAILRAASDAVGLAGGESGNCAAGHLTIGSGRQVLENLPRVDEAMRNKSFYENHILLKSVRHAKKNNSCLHLMGLVSDGRVHASLDHIGALLLLAQKEKLEKVYIHAILDGRDTASQSSINAIAGLEEFVHKTKIGAVASLIGRFYAMDRNNYYERTLKAYEMLTEKKGQKIGRLQSAIRKIYAKKINDEEFPPSLFCKHDNPIAQIKDNDSIIFFNHRGDRLYQLARAFVDQKGIVAEHDVSFMKLNNLNVTTLVDYGLGQKTEIAFPEEPIKNTLSEMISTAGLKQTKIMETDKYAPLTYFFNGKKEKNFFGEEKILISNYPFDNLVLRPEMESSAVLEKSLEILRARRHEFIAVNFCNADTVGRASDLSVIIKAVEEVDKCLGTLVEETLSLGGTAVITADHGRVESMVNPKTGLSVKERSLNPVPFIIASHEVEGKNIFNQNSLSVDLSILHPIGLLSDVAPTILKLINIEQPQEMTGKNLISNL